MDFLTRLDTAFGTTLPISKMALRLLMAAALSMLVGWERDVHAHPAGLRTHMLVGTGSATFIIIALEIVVTGGTSGDLRYDPTGVVAGVIGGIGFLGAGSIIRAEGGVRGLTTAAGIWVVGWIGLACGLGQYEIACLSTAFVMFILAVVGWLERRLSHRK